ncbi:MAG: hypothetical protein ACK4N5_06720 [Myxococcales bacterium]
MGTVRLLLAVTFTALLAPGCAPTCTEACENIAAVCPELANAECRNECERTTENDALCANGNDIRRCLESAEDCTRVRACPPCRPARTAF